MEQIHNLLDRQIQLDLSLLLPSLKAMEQENFCVLCSAGTEMELT